MPCTLRSRGQVWPDALVAPLLVVGATDARHWARMSDAVYRFSPMRADATTLQRVHGTDGGVPVRDVPDGVRVQAQLIREAAR